MNAIQIYTDGACKGNPGPGGWGVLLRSPDGSEKELFGGELGTTNNRMEMTAAIAAFEYLLEKKLNNLEFLVYTDSNYLIKGITEWIFGWQKKNWKTAGGDSVLNKDLWEKLFALTNLYFRRKFSNQIQHHFVW
mgnify:CR=1 FL=1